MLVRVAKVFVGEGDDVAKELMASVFAGCAVVPKALCPIG